MIIKALTASFFGILLAIAPMLNLLAQDYDWLHYANDQSSSKYADLDQINKDTVQDIQIAWTWASVDNAQISERPQFIPAGFKSTPVQKDGILYILSLIHI